MMKNVLRVTVTALMTFAALPGFARGTPESSPQIAVRSETGVFISPNGDGVQDALTLSTEVGQAPARAVKSFELTVFGTSDRLAGVVVWTRRDVQTESRRFLGNLLNVGEEPGVSIPETLTWDGTFGASDAGADGSPVPDGEYIYQLTVSDETGATVSTPPMNVTVDRKPPTVGRLSASYSVFSPNGDGVRDDVSIGQSGSREVDWRGRIETAAGVPVREFTWTNPDRQSLADDAVPPDFRWDGTSQAGTTVADGVYRYILVGTDRAGNTAESTAIELRVSTRGGAVQAVPRALAFSPNGDGERDTLAVDMIVAEPDGIVDYEIAVASAGSPDDTLWSTSGASPVPQTVTLTGLDRRGQRLADGSYEIRLSVDYENGNRAVSEPAGFDIDTVPPGGIVTARVGPLGVEPGEPMVFGGTNRTYVDVTVSLSEQLEWTAVAGLGEASYRVPLAELGVSETDFSFRWDGTDLSGQPLPDGLATLRFDATDAAGNSGSTNQVRVIRDTRAPEVSVSFAAPYLSPDGDGVNDTVRVDLAYSVGDLIDEFLLSIADEEGRIIRTEYKRTPFSSFEWLGRTNGNTVVPDGRYFAELRVLYYNGNEPVARSGPVVVDRTNPQVIELTAPYRLFSPDGDGERDTVDIRQRTSSESEWIGQITDVADTPVFERRWAGEAMPFTWDGRDATGNVVPDGDYTYTIRAVDSAGNEGAEDLTLVVDTRSAPVSQQPPAVSLTAGPLPFTPDGDGTNDRLTMTAAAASENTLARWDLVITDPFGADVRRWSGTGAPRRFTSWDGKAADGELVQSAQEYTATLTVTDDRGNTGSSSVPIEIGILVIREGTILRIMVPSIHFAPYTADLFQVSSAELEQNLETLRSLAAVLNRFPEYRILIEGHAAHDYYQDGPRKEREQIEELIPLSAARAEEVRQALIILGVDGERMRTIGIGGARPVVPHSDRENLWKNRRVEFILERG